LKYPEVAGMLMTIAKVATHTRAAKTAANANLSGVLRMFLSMFKLYHRVAVAIFRRVPFISIFFYFSIPLKMPPKGENLNVSALLDIAN
jgi:hypothetical protein